MKKIGMKKIGVFDHPDGIIRPELKKHYCYEIVKKEGETGG
jgi:RimJ/RimL family protein N-acetyltransferase